MTAGWILPSVTLIVASSVGGELALALRAYSLSCALTTLAFSIFILSIGLALAFMVLTVYFDRLIVHGFPPGKSIVSSFIASGPFGQAGFSVLNIGNIMKETLPVPGSRSPFLNSTQTGEIAFTLCVCLSFVLWAFATMWIVYGLLGLQHVFRRGRITFDLSFWGMIFPNVSHGRSLLCWIVLYNYSQGVYAILTVALYQTLDVTFFRVWGTTYSIFTIILWFLFLCRTAVDVPGGRIFDAPCLKET